MNNMDPPPDGNFCDDSKRHVTPHIVERYNQQMGYVNNSNLIANSYSKSRCNFYWTMKLSFYLLDLTVG